MKYNVFLSRVLIFLFAISAAFSIYSIFYSKFSDSVHVEPSAVRHVEVWSEQQLMDIEKFGKSNGVRPSDPSAFVERIRSGYVRVERPKFDANNKTIYYVRVGLGVNVDMLVLASLCLIAVGVLQFAYSEKIRMSMLSEIKGEGRL